MIYESHSWKEGLRKQALSLRRRISQKRWLEASFAHVEQAVMLGFYAIRKLLEAHKLSDDVANRNLQVSAHSWKRKRVTRLNRFEYWEMYDLEHSKRVTRSLAFLCNQIVHSYIFAISFDEFNRFDGILVTSDRERHQALYFIQIQQIVELFEQVGNNYPNEVILDYDPSIQDYRIQSKVRPRN